MLVRRSVFAAFALLAACGRDSAVEPAPTSTQAPAARPARSIAAQLRSFGHEADPTVRFERDDLGLRPVFASALSNAPKSFAADRVVLPSDARGALVVRKGDVAVRVSLAADAATARAEDGVLVYDRAIDGGTLVRAPRPDGAEDFALFDARPAGPRELRYRVSLEGVAGLRLVEGHTLELLTADGNPVLHTGAPVTTDRAGRQTLGALRVEGCAVDTSLELPWGRPVVDPGATSCTVVATWSDEGLEYPIVVDPAWTTTGGLLTKRAYHAATMARYAGTCANGCVVVTGGLNATMNTIAAAEVWRPATGTFAAAGNDPCGARYKSGAAFDGVGAVIAGGRSGTTASTATACTSFWDGSKAAWGTSPANMPTGARFDVAAATTWSVGLDGVPYESGVVFAGGRNTSNTPVSTVERWGGTWQTNGTPTARAEAAVVSWGIKPAFSSVRPTCIIGGFGTSGTRLSTVDCTTDLKGGTTTWTTTSTAMSGQRARLGVAQYKNLVYVAGGGTAKIDSIDLSPSGGPVLSTTPHSIADRNDIAGAFALPSSTSTAASYLFIGGIGTALSSSAVATVDIVGPAGKSVSSLGTARAGAAAVTLPDGRVVVVGGNSGTVTAYTFPTAEEIFALQPAGAACGAGGECASGFCADGVCCNTACNGTCESCDQKGFAGTCRPQPAGSLPATGHPSCPAPAGGTCGYKCDGVNRTACAVAGTTVSCAAASCVGNVLTPASTCDGAGTCALQAAAACPNKLVCASGTTCKTTCTANADCVTGYKCEGGVCVTTGAKGTDCADASDCAAGLSCTDGVCCESSACPTDHKCSLPGSLGTCKKVDGTACADGSDCGTGFCVDGVCCDQICGGQCQACDVPGAIGKCVAVTGEPHGSRPKCADGGADVCRALTCDGNKDLTKCAAFAHGLDFVCGRSCSGGTQEEQFCDGEGSCGAPKKTTCGGYACGDDRCRTTCTSNADCDPKFACNKSSGKCEPANAACSDDLRSSIPADGSAPTPCLAYLCEKATGACHSSCTSSEQCAPGYACADSACVATPTDAGEADGGCALGSPRQASRSLIAAVLGLAALGAWRRRRR